MTFQRQFETLKAEALKQLDRMALKDRLGDATSYLNGLLMLKNMAGKAPAHVRQQLAREIWEVRQDVKITRYLLRHEEDREVEVLPVVEWQPIEDRSL